MILTRTNFFACFAFGVVLNAQASLPVVKKPFGITASGTPVQVYTLKNHNGMSVSITNYGATVVSLTAPDRDGKFADVVLGCGNVQDYERQDAHLGGLVGRYANRIGHAKFTLNGVEFHTPKNDGDNTLHSGKGFDRHVWNAKVTYHPEGPALELTYTSKDGEEGFPGKLAVKVVYRLTDRNELKIDYTATTDKPTVVNLTNHSYFNLAGEGQGDVLQHQVTIYADRFTPVDAGLIPDGTLATVKGTPLDFTTATAIGARIEDHDPQLVLGHGYDHNWVLNKRAGQLSLAAQVFDPKSGRLMEVWTTEPGLQFYTGNFLDGSIHGKGGKTYPRRSALCLETQHFPDSPNKPNFPDTTLNPGGAYRTTTSYKFSSR